MNLRTFSSVPPQQGESPVNSLRFFCLFSQSELADKVGCITEIAVEAMQALSVDSMSTSTMSESIETFVGCNPTIRFDCNLIDLVLRLSHFALTTELPGPRH